MTLLSRFFEPFVPETESINSYLERADLYLKASSMVEAKTVPVFLSAIGLSAYTVLRDLCRPALPETESYEQLQHLLKQQYDPKPLFIAERFYISQRNQAEGESIANYIAELRHMSANCEYGEFPSEFLDQALCDRFVAGLKREGLQRQLLSEEKLTFAKAVQKAKAFEVTEMNSKALKYPEPMTVKKLAPTSSYFRCGKSNHLPEECRFQNATCHNCG